MAGGLSAPAGCGACPQERVPDKQSQDWALSHAPNATRSFYCEHPRSEQELSRLLTAAARSLALRGGRRTNVALCCAPGPATDAALGALSQGLSGAGAGVSWLTLVTGFEHISSTVAHFVRNVAPSVFPNLTNISFWGPLYPLPPPNHMPQLRVVAASRIVRHSASALAFYDSVALYMPQLDSLDMGLYDQEHVAAVYERLFCPASTSHTLTHFNTGNYLTDDLLDLLLTHAPALTQLDVIAFDEGLGDHSGKEWGVGQVRVLLLTRPHPGITAILKLPRLRGGGSVVIWNRGRDYKPSLSLTAQVRVDTHAHTCTIPRIMLAEHMYTHRWLNKSSP